LNSGWHRECMGWSARSYRCSTPRSAISRRNVERAKATDPQEDGRMTMNAWTETRTLGERVVPLCRGLMQPEPRFARALRVCLSGTLAALLIVLLAGCDAAPMQPAMAGGYEDSSADIPPESPDFAMMLAAVPELSAGDLRGGVTLAQIAARWVQHAERLHGRATALAGPDPQPPVSAWLQAAGQLLGQAMASLASGNHQAAIAQSQASVHLSNQVIDALHVPPEPLDLEKRAAAAIDLARELLAEATILGGGAPSERVAAALVRSALLLDEAQAAFSAQDYAAAIRLARQSAGISQAVIRYLQV